MRVRKFSRIPYVSLRECKGGGGIGGNVGGISIGVGKGQSLIMEERPPIGLGNGRGSILGGGQGKIINNI